MSHGQRPAGGPIAESLAASVLRHVPALTDTLVHTIEQQNPGYQAVNVVPADDLWKSCHDNITRVLQLLSGVGREGTMPEDAGYYDAAWATGQRRAQQQMPLDDVLRSFRLGGRLVWEALIDQAREQGTVDTEGLLDVASRVWEVVDATSAQVAAAYHAAQRQLVRADEQRKAALWEGLLQGRAKDAAFAYEAARIVGLPVKGPYAVVAVDDRGDGKTTVVLGDGLAGVGIDSAWQVRANTLVGLLALGEPGIGSALEVLHRVLDMPAGVSLVVDGLAEVSVGYGQAMLARRTLSARQPGGVVSLGQRLPEALLLGSPELAERLVRLWLGPLLDLPVTERQLLLETLQTWISTAGSTSRTAEIVHCHRNTVINRMRRIQAITGHDFAAEASPIELSLALRASHLVTSLPPRER